MAFVDSVRGAEVSGSRFAYLANEAVLVELALLQWVMGLLVEHGFTPIAPPVLVREHAMEEAGFFPTDRAQVYEVDGLLAPGRTLDAGNSGSTRPRVIVVPSISHSAL